MGLEVSLQALSVTLGKTPENGKVPRALYGMYESHRQNLLKMGLLGTLTMIYLHMQPKW